MPLISHLVDNRYNTTAIAGKTTVRYCDSAYRHRISGPTYCSLAAPEITALVPEEQRHTRLREGGESTHYSFNAIQTASLLLRLNKRFESIDNDRQENIVDVLNDINNRFKETNGFLQRVALQVDSEGTVSQLLKQICDAVKRSAATTESPHMETLAKNTSSLVEYASEQILETKEFKNDLEIFGKVIKDTHNNHMTDVKSILEKNFEELSAIKAESQLVSTSLERMEATAQMNGLDMKQEMTELRHEVIQLKEELRSLREAIIEDLPTKLADALYPKSNSSLGSDVSVIEKSIELEEKADNHLDDDTEVDADDEEEAEEKEEEDDNEETDEDSRYADEDDQATQEYVDISE